MDQPTTSAPTIPILSRQRPVLLVLILLAIGGAVLALWRPLWLTPPVFYNTPLVYAVCASLWIPLLFIVLIIPATRRQFAGLRQSMFVGVIIVAIFIALGISGILIVYGITLNLPGFWDCSRYMSNGLVQWSCRTTLVMDSWVDYIFEGVEGQPVARLVEIRSGSISDTP